MNYTWICNLILTLFTGSLYFQISFFKRIIKIRQKYNFFFTCIKTFNKRRFKIIWAKCKQQALIWIKFSWQNFTSDHSTHLNTLYNKIIDKITEIVIRLVFISKHLNFKLKLFKRELKRSSILLLLCKFGLWALFKWILC